MEQADRIASGIKEIQRVDENHFIVLDAGIGNKSGAEEYEKAGGRDAAEYPADGGRFPDTFRRRVAPGGRGNLKLCGKILHVEGRAFI